ncbi:HP1 family phage holin [Shewanella sp. MEBiC00475]|uniref:HP1 family phage holin n=1 Tax=Shewanella sp. MEBiC00475 TaxID=2575361 RepID=UPI0020C76ED9|nr:HP1 family phage holin [Shewanella sp. MEBiC00475]
MSITTDLSAKLTSLLSYIASFFTAAGSYVNDMDIGVLVGVLCAIATALVNWFYQARKSQRENHIQTLQAQLLTKQLQHIEEERCSHVLDDMQQD